MDTQSVGSVLNEQGLNKTDINTSIAYKTRESRVKRVVHETRESGNKVSRLITASKIIGGITVLASAIVIIWYLTQQSVDQHLQDENEYLEWQNAVLTDQNSQNELVIKDLINKLAEKCTPQNYIVDCVNSTVSNWCKWALCPIGTQFYYKCSF